MQSDDEWYIMIHRQRLKRIIVIHLGPHLNSGWTTFPDKPEHKWKLAVRFMWRPRLNRSMFATYPAAGIASLVSARIFQPVQDTASPFQKGLNRFLRPTAPRDALLCGPWCWGEFFPVCELTTARGLSALCPCQVQLQGIRFWTRRGPYQDSRKQQRGFGPA